MTKEELKELFNEWLDGKTIQFYQTDQEKWVDLKTPSWDTQFKYRVKPTKITFKDCYFNNVEFYVNTWAEVKTFTNSMCPIKDRKGFFRDQTTAKAFSVLPQLVRLRDRYNEGQKIDWTDNKCKYTIETFDGEVSTSTSYRSGKLIAFNSGETRNRFLNDHRDLLEIAKPFL